MTARHRSSNGDGAIDTLNPDELGSGAVGRGTSDDSELLVVDDLSVGFGTEDGTVHAVRNVSFTLGTRQVLGIVGESGSGKSVSSMAIMGLLPKTATVTGSIKFHGRELVGLPYGELRKLRGSGISMIFQDPMTSMNPVFTVGWQLSEAYRAHHNVSKRAAWAKSVEALEMVGIPQPDRRAAQYPHEFSGGMRQRAVIAMSIINDPELIIADEPTTALDVTVQAQILETLIRIKDETNAAVIMITHDLGVVAGMVDRVQVMYGGTVVESGVVEEVFAAPRMPYTIGLLGSIPNPAMVGKRLTPIKGAPPSLMNLPNGCPFTPRCPLAIDECRESEPALTETDRRDHRARCHRWSDLLTIESPQLLFDQQEIGMVENPAALTAADPDLPIMEDVISVEQRMAAAAEDREAEHNSSEETTS
ncbi:MAG TPA: ABC transporter ATP-binding protein [Pseudonocardiaceae bacterium]